MIQIRVLYRTDHSLVVFKFKDTIHDRQNILKFNNLLLKDQDYVQNVKQVLDVKTQ